MKHRIRDQIQDILSQNLIVVHFKQLQSLAVDVADHILRVQQHIAVGNLFQYLVQHLVLVVQLAEHHLLPPAHVLLLQFQGNQLAHALDKIQQSPALVLHLLNVFLLVTDQPHHPHDAVVIHNRAVNIAHLLAVVPLVAFQAGRAVAVHRGADGVLPGLDHPLDDAPVLRNGLVHRTRHPLHIPVNDLSVDTDGEGNSLGNSLNKLPDLH